MGQKLFSNNARTTLKGNISSSSTSLVVASTTNFPVISTAGNYFYITITDNISNWEIVQVTATTGTTFTVVRGMDNTTALAWSSGAVIEVRPIAQSLRDITGAFTASTGASILGSQGSFTHEVASTQSQVNQNIFCIFRWFTPTQILYATSFGSSGSNTNMGVAIQNAITDLSTNGGIITFPPGLYDHQGLTITDQVSLEGSGAGEGSDSTPPIWSSYRGTVLRNTSNTNSITIINGSIDVRNVRLRNLRITSTGSALIGITAIQWGNIDALQGVVVDSHVTGGLYLYQCWDLVVRDSWIVSNTGYGATISYQSNAIVFDHTIIMSNGTDGLSIASSDNIVVTNACDFESNGHDHIHVVTGPVRGITVRDSYFETVSPQVSGYAAIRFEASTTDTALITGCYWDGSNGTSSATAVTFLDVETGNSRINLDTLSFSPSNSTSYSSFVSFKAGAGSCTAEIAPGSSLAYNASSSCRIYYDPYTETGINAGNTTTQTFTALTWVAILAPTISYDTKSEWNTSTGAFTPKDYGLYDIEAAVAMTVTAGDNYQIRLYDTTGSAVYAEYFWQAMTAGVQTLKVSFKELLAPSTTMQIQVYVPSGGRTTNSSGGVAGNWVRVHRVS